MHTPKSTLIMATRLPKPKFQRGLTLVELMVSMVIALLIVVAAAAALFVTRRGYTSVDAATQMRENARFASDLIQRLIAQAGYEDCAGGCSAMSGAFTGAAPTASLMGFDGARWSKAPSGSADPDQSNTTASDASNGFSDILIVRFQGASDAAGTADGTMVNCGGMAEPAKTPTGEINKAISVLYVAPSNSDGGEPNLMCAYRNVDTGKWSTSQPLISGVESMKIIYGRNTAAADAAPNIVYQSADQLNTGTAEEIRTNWRSVVTVKVGLVMRSGKAAVPAEAASAVFYPLGKDHPDAALEITKAQSLEGRARQTTTLTAFLRNRPL